MAHKMNYHPYYNKAFHFIKIVLGFNIVVGAIGICDHTFSSFIIHVDKCCSKTQHVPIYMQLKWPSLNGLLEDYCRFQPGFKFFKNMFLFIFPLSCLFHLCQLGERLHNDTKPLHKLSKVICQCHESLNLALVFVGCGIYM
jgi:hypothetical protein